MKDHYGNETFALQPISKIDIPAKIIKTLRKTKIFSINAYKKVSYQI